MHLLGVKPTPQKDLQSFPIKTYPKSLKLPNNFDARTAWPQCNTIGRILGQLVISFYTLLSRVFFDIKIKRQKVLMNSPFYVKCWINFFNEDQVIICPTSHDILSNKLMPKIQRENLLFLEI